MNIESLELIQFIKNILVPEGTVGIEPYSNVFPEIFASNILKHIALFFEVESSYFKLDTPEAIADLDLNLLQHEVHPTHPYKAIDGYGFESSTEYRSGATISQVEQSRLHCKYQRRHISDRRKLLVYIMK